jgi:hypothetical protein
VWVVPSRKSRRSQRRKTYGHKGHTAEADTPIIPTELPARGPIVRVRKYDQSIKLWFIEQGYPLPEDIGMPNVKNKQMNVDARRPRSIPSESQNRQESVEPGAPFGSDWSRAVTTTRGTAYESQVAESLPPFFPLDTTSS